MKKTIKERIKDACGVAVFDVMNSAKMDTTCLGAIADMKIEGVIVCMAMIGIAALCYFVFGLTALAIGIVLYSIVDILVIIIGCKKISDDVLDEWNKETEELYKEFEKITKEISEE